MASIVAAFVGKGVTFYLSDLASIFNLEFLALYYFYMEHFQAHARSLTITIER